MTPSSRARGEPDRPDGVGVAGAVLAAVYVLAGRSVRQRLSLFAYAFVVNAVVHRRARVTQ